MGVRRRPLDAERPDELALVAGPVDGVGGQPMPVQILTIQRCPASVRALDTVGHHHMGVYQRVTLSGRSVVEADRQEPLAGHVLVAAVTAASTKVSVQIGDRLVDTSMVGGEDRPTGRGVAQAVQDRHALGRPQDHVEGRHGVAAMGAAEQLASCRVATLEHGLEPGHRCFALQPQAGGAGAVPAAWTLTVARQILLVVGGQLAGVILLPSHRELRDVGHHPAAPLPPASARANAPLVHCSPQKNGFGVRVGRKLACERRLRGVRGCGYFLVRSDRQLWKQGMAGAVDG
jgi:hypothetical protein